MAAEVARSDAKAVRATAAVAWSAAQGGSRTPRSVLSPSGRAPCFQRSVRRGGQGELCGVACPGEELHGRSAVSARTSGGSSSIAATLTLQKSTGRALTGNALATASTSVRPDRIAFRMLATPVVARRRTAPIRDLRRYSHGCSEVFWSSAASVSRTAEAARTSRGLDAAKPSLHSARAGKREVVKSCSACFSLLLEEGGHEPGYEILLAARE